MYQDDVLMNDDDLFENSEQREGRTERFYTCLHRCSMTMARHPDRLPISEIAYTILVNDLKARPRPAFIAAWIIARGRNDTIIRPPTCKY